MLLSLTALVTAGYSLYAEFRALAQAPAFTLRQESEAGKLALVLSGDLPNAGLYPLAGSLALALRVGQEPLALAAPAPFEIAPGSRGAVSARLTLEPFSVGNESLLRRLLLNGTTALFLANLSLTLRPLASAQVSIARPTSLPPAMGNLSVGRPTLSLEGGRIVISIPVAFRNYTPLTYTASLSCALSMQGSVLGLCEPVTVEAPAGQGVALVLRLSLMREPSPPYLLELHVRVGQRELLIPVQVSG
ncbi:MAG: hypothetical protein C4339_04670 [Nitrososphaerota archaeon]